MARPRIRYVAYAVLVLGVVVACGEIETNSAPVVDGRAVSSSSGRSSTSSGASAVTSSSSGNTPDDVDASANSGTDAGADAMPDSGPAPDAGSGDASVDAAVLATDTPIFTTNPPPPAPSRPFTTPVQVTMSSATPNATIFYTLDGTNPTTISTIFTAPITVSTTTSIRAIAIASGRQNSDVASTTLTIDTSPCCTPPVAFTPFATVQANTFNVSLSSLNFGATICYTTDGVTNPTCTNGVCNGGSSTFNAAAPIPITQTNTVVSALACREASANTSASSQTYRLRVAAVSASPGPGTMAGPADITLSTSTFGGTIHYTTNGSTVTCNSGVSAPSPGDSVTVHLTATTTLHAIACRTAFEDSDESTFAYTLTP